MIRIALLGGPGSGKSTQCAHFFSILKTESVLIEQVQEWVREAFNKGLLPSNNP
jgi:adenylate kinase family enzyme